MPKNRTARPSSLNVTASHSEEPARHIPYNECDASNPSQAISRDLQNASEKDLDLAFAERVRELLGKETRVSFATACKFSEGALRKYLKGHRPGRDNLVAMADYRNVSVAWLATGVPPKEKKALMQYALGTGKTGTTLTAVEQTMANGATYHSAFINAELLRICLLTCKQVFGEEFSNALITVQVQYAVDFYNHLIQMANSKTPPAAPADFCLLDAGALAEQLRFLVKMGWARNFPAASEGNS